LTGKASWSTNEKSEGSADAWTVDEAREAGLIGERWLSVTIVRVGATEKYSVGWENAFGKGKGRATAAPQSAKHAPSKTAASKAVSTKKAAGKKKSKKKK
jgi:hypothetical protein